MDDESSAVRGEHEHGDGVRRNNDEGLLSTAANLEGAQKRQRVERSASVETSAGGGGEATAVEQRGIGAHQVGPPQQADQPLPGAAKYNPPVPRDCRICGVHFESGADLFKHLPQSRLQC